MSVLSRFINLWRARTLDDEFSEELEFHLDQRTESNRRTGMSATDARAEAQKHLGGLGARARATEGMREARVLHWLDTLWRDLHYGARQFRRQPGTTALAVVMLSLGIGATGVMFSLLYAVLFRPLPFPGADRLAVVVDRMRVPAGVVETSPTVPELLDVEAWSEDFDTSFYDTRDFQLGGGTEPTRVFAARVEVSFLSLLGVRPQLGRLFQDTESRPGGDRAVILSDSLWRRNFGADPSVIGRQIVVNGNPWTVLGVLPSGFSFDYLVAEPIEMFVPFPNTPTYTSRTGEFANVRRVTGLARLEQDVPMERASSALQAFSRQLVQDHPELYRRGSDGQDLGFSMDVQPLRAAVTGGARSLLFLLIGAVILVLLIACVNTAQFLIARAIAREPEVAVRSALGASRSRLIRQFLAEALLLALTGAVLGLLQTVWLTDAVVSLLPPATPIVGATGVNLVVIGCAAALTVLTTVVFGLLPAFRFSNFGVTSHFEHRTTSSHRKGRQVLIAVEVALSLVLLVGAGALLQGIRERLNAPRGYADTDVVTMRMRISGRAGQLPHTGLAYQQYLDRITALPGVAAAAVSDSLLPRGAGADFVIDGGADDAATLAQQQASYQIVSPGYFATVGIPFRAGRSFRADETLDRPRVAIVNEAMALAFWPGQNAIGHRIRSGIGPRNASMTIVGVVGNVRAGLQADTPPQIYVSYLQQSEPIVNLLIRSAPGVPVSMDLVKRAIWSVFPDQPVFSVRPLSAVIAQWSAEPRTIARMLGIFALLALFMSVTGVYTVVSYLVSRRVKEIALRRAIGAGPWDVMKLLAGETLGWSAVGVALGLVATTAGGSALRAILGDLATPDTTTVIVVAVAYLLVVSAALCVPAFRALRLDPAAVLRND